MKLTYGQIHIMVGENGAGPLATLRQKELPVSASLKLRRIVRAIEPLYSDLTAERNQLIEKFGEEGVVKFQSERFPEFAMEDKKLMETEVEVDFEPLSISDIGNITLSEVDLSALMAIIQE